MRIAIIGDIHSNLINLQKSLSIIQEKGLAHIIVVGDLQSPEVIDIIGSTNKKISIVFGNADFDRESFIKRAKKYKNIEIFGDFGELDFNNRKIGFCHFYSEAKEIATKGIYDIVFCGHKHSPIEEKINSTILIRPGEIAGQYCEPTFCIYDLDKMKAELVLLNR